MVPTETGLYKLKSVVVRTKQTSYPLLHGTSTDHDHFFRFVLCFVWFRNTISCVICRFKFPYPLQWGPPTFAAGHSFAMMSAVLVSMIEVLYGCPFRLLSLWSLLYVATLDLVDVDYMIDGPPFTGL